VGSQRRSRLRVTAALIPRRAGVPLRLCGAANPPAARWWLAVVARARLVAAVRQSARSRRTGQRSAGAGICARSGARCGAGLPPPRAELPGIASHPPVGSAPCAPCLTHPPPRGPRKAPATPVPSEPLSGQAMRA